jgi:hypothetical protein
MPGEAAANNMGSRAGLDIAAGALWAAFTRGVVSHFSNHLIHPQQQASSRQACTGKEKGALKRLGLGDVLQQSRQHRMPVLALAATLPACLQMAARVGSCGYSS